MRFEKLSSTSEIIEYQVSCLDIIWPQYFEYWIYPQVFCLAQQTRNYIQSWKPISNSNDHIGKTSKKHLCLCIYNPKKIWMSILIFTTQEWLHANDSGKTAILSPKWNHFIFQFYYIRNQPHRSLVNSVSNSSKFQVWFSSCSATLPNLKKYWFPVPNVE
jgi:hypothetical protein